MKSKSALSFQVIGVMSGTSLDGLDLAHVCFQFLNGRWTFRLKKTITVPHLSSILSELEQAAFTDDAHLALLDNKLGEFIGESIVSHFQDVLSDIDFIASHGHTAKHNPKESYTLQLGSAKEILSITGRPVINNFRAKDVALGGQGAPLVPIGDRDLFSSYDFCLNLGGIANTSFSQNGLRLAYDICPFNMALNELSSELGYAYDAGGDLAAQGVIDEDLMQALEEMLYYKRTYPKSLGYEDYKADWFPKIAASKSVVQDKLRTLNEHFANQVAISCGGKNASGKMIVTGGGAYNTFFINCLEKRLPNIEIEIPEKSILEFKEALVFAYLGVLRRLDLPNALASVTGANADNSGGDMLGF